MTLLSALFHPVLWLALGFVGVWLYLAVLLAQTRRRLRTAAEAAQSREAALEVAVSELSRQLAEHSARLEEVAEASGALVAPPPPRSGLNLSRRSEALRLFRRGERPEQIAAALGLPLGEVELLEKVQRILHGEDRGAETPRSVSPPTSILEGSPPPAAASLAVAPEQMA